MKHFLQDMDDELLVKFLLDEVTEPERLRVYGWIQRAPGNEKYFNQFQQIWQQSKLLAKTSEVNEEAAWLRFQKRIANQGKSATVIPFKKPFNWLRIAAVFITTIAVAALFYFVSNAKIEQVEFASNDKIVKDTLPDNSVVTLNKNSTLKYEEKSGINSYRKAVLKGEGFFNVMPNKSRPFLVEVDGIEVKVVGTSFNVKSNKDFTEIVVESGIVTVTKDKKLVTLTRGEKITVPKSGVIPEKTVNSDKLYNYYRSREFVCDNTPLWKLIQVLNEAYETNIVIENKQAASELYTATFYNEPIENILAVIAETFHLTITRQGGKIILK